jgi:hypothetical protein
MISVSSPATIFDMAELGGAATRLHWAVVREMWSAGETFAVRRGDDLIAIAGLYPVAQGAEAWFNVRPAAAGSMRAIIRAIRLTLTARAYPEIVVICTTAAGRRIASACGFEFVEHCDIGEIWHGQFAGRKQQRAGSGEAAGGATAAPHAGGSGEAAGGGRPGGGLEQTGTFENR